MANVLNQYCYALGQAINLNKSGLFTKRDCPQSLKHNLATELRVLVIDKTSKYLGIPSGWGQTKKQMFAWILAKVKQKLEGWKERLISKEGKEVSIKIIIQALPQYAMSIFKIPISICCTVEQRVASFWWKHNAARRGIHWKKWEEKKN